MTDYEAVIKRLLKEIKDQDRDPVAIVLSKKTYESMLKREQHLADRAMKKVPTSLKMISTSYGVLPVEITKDTELPIEIGVRWQ